jgi:Zn ribbon nucleic-acid-binding protein
VTEFTGAILMCPVCSSTDDADGWGLNEVDCSNCDTHYTVVLEPQKVAEHAMHG